MFVRGRARLSPLSLRRPDQLRAAAAARQASTFTPGNFSARFGRKMGGIIDVGIRDPKTDGLHGHADINLVDSSFLVEGPLGQAWSFAVAAKRSYIDFFIDKLVPQGRRCSSRPRPCTGTTRRSSRTSPSARPLARHGLRLVRRLQADPGHPRTATRPCAAASRQQRLSPRAARPGSTSLGAPSSTRSRRRPVTLRAELVADDAELPRIRRFLRSEWRARSWPQLSLIGGLDVALLVRLSTFRARRARRSTAIPTRSGPLTGRQGRSRARSTSSDPPPTSRRLAADDRLTLVPGARVDYIGDVELDVRPALTARFQLTPTRPAQGRRRSVLAGAEFGESVPDRQPAPGPPPAQHYSLGVEHAAAPRG